MIRFLISRLARAILPRSAGGTSSSYRIFLTPEISTVRKPCFPGKKTWVEIKMASFRRLQLADTFDASRDHFTRGEAVKNSQLQQNQQPYFSCIFEALWVSQRSSSSHKSLNSSCNILQLGSPNLTLDFSNLCNSTCRFLVSSGKHRKWHQPYYPLNKTYLWSIIILYDWLK